MPDPKSKTQSIEQCLPVRIEYFEEITSTNDLASSRKDHGCLIWAENQTKGRGQRGNSWSSSTGKNLTFSLVICPEKLPAENQFYISKVVSIAMIEALAEFGLKAEIKWPNDIYIGNKKIAGILIENDLQGTDIIKSILGIGLNVNQEVFDPALPNPTSMLLSGGSEVDRMEVLRKILERIFFWNNHLNNKEYELIDMTYSRHLYRLENRHLFQEPGGEPFKASIKKVLPSGELILKRADGSCKGYFFKEIEFIL